jgi:putative ABC transport system substrate-binding protein
MMCASLERSVGRRDFLLAAGLGLALPRIASAQTARAVRRVGMSGVPNVVRPLHAAFRQAMLDLGWVEGKDIEYRTAPADRAEAGVREFIEWNADVIVTSSSQFARAAQHATTTIPIVLAGVLNAVGAGFVASLAKPGGNITGITSLQEEVLAKLIEIVHEIAPRARRVAILLNETNPSHGAFWSTAKSACAKLGLEALRAAANSPSELTAAIGRIDHDRAQAVVVVADSMFGAQNEKLHSLLEALRLPVGYQLREFVVGGGLVSYGADLAANWSHAARYVDRILRGAKPADLPVEQAPKYDLVVNLKTAKALGLTVPQSLLLRADVVIQ